MFLKIRVNHLVRNADLKSISIPPNLFAIITEPIATNEFFDLVPKSLIITRKKEIPKGDRCLIEEMPTKDGNTKIYPCVLCLARGVKR